MTLRDTLERLLWTVVSAGGAALAAGPLLGVTAWQAAGVAGLSAGVNFLTIVARSRLSVLPDPGEGLPGLGPDGGAIDGGGLLVFVVGFLLGALCVKAGVLL